MCRRCRVGFGHRTVMTALGVFTAYSLITSGKPSHGAEVYLMNKLATASSPYLREAATQPVAWSPWGEEPFRLAKEEVAEGIIMYVNRVLSDQVNGGFYAHQDADMGPGDDGAYFTWTVQEVK